MRRLYKIALVTVALVAFAFPQAAKAPARTAAQTTTTLRPQPRFNATFSTTFTSNLTVGTAHTLSAVIQWHQLAWQVGAIPPTTCTFQLQIAPAATGPWTASSFQTGDCSHNGTEATQHFFSPWVRLASLSFSGPAGASVTVHYYGFNSNPGGGGGGGGGGVTNFLVQPPNLPLCTPPAPCATNPSPNTFLYTTTVNTATTTPTLFFTPQPAPAGSMLGNNGTTAALPTWVPIPTGGGGTGNLTGTLTANFVPKATGTNTLANSLFTDNGNTGIYSGAFFGVGAGDTSCGTSSGCIGFTESAIPGAPTAGHTLIRADTSHTLKVRNAAMSAEQFLPTTTNTGTFGQIPISNGNGTYTNADPAVSFNSAVLFSNANAAVQQGSSAVANPMHSLYGSLVITNSNPITPGTCSIQLSVTGNLGFNTPFATINFQLAGGGGAKYSYPVIPDSSVAVQGDAIAATYNCTAFPPVGTTFSAVFEPSVPSAPPIVACDKKVIINAPALATTTLVASVANTRVFVCGWTVNTASTAAVDVSLVQGSGTGCPTSQAPFTETITLQSLPTSSPVGQVVNAPDNVIDATPPGLGICLVVGGNTPTAPVFGKVWYAQF